MRLSYLMLGVAAVGAATAAQAGSQSSNTSSNSSSNNGVVRERIIDTYCEDGYCERYALRRAYRDDRRKFRYRGYDRRRSNYYRDTRREDDDD